MKMPDVVLCFPDYDTSGGWISTKETHERENGQQYHHSRIVEALRQENEELQAKLDKAKLEDCVTVENFKEVISRRIMDLVDIMGRFPEFDADERAWSHLLIYVPKNLLKGTE